MASHFRNTDAERNSFHRINISTKAHTSRCTPYPLVRGTWWTTTKTHILTKLIYASAPSAPAMFLTLRLVATFSLTVERLPFVPVTVAIVLNNVFLETVVAFPG